MSKYNRNDGYVRSGYLKKLKTMKKKYFVLYKDTDNNIARLEYFDNERKYKSGVSPKRIFKLRDCLNINRRHDTKYDYVIALSLKDGGFGIVLETEDDMKKWLEDLVSLQRNDVSFSSNARPFFTNIWQVDILKRGLAEDKNLFGTYYVGLTNKCLTFIRIGTERTTITGESRVLQIEIVLTTIRRCGDSQNVFYMEVGRQSVIGPGELWMETDDTLIAQNMHKTILSAMSVKSDFSNMEPMRKRSSSANEASKPINVLHKKQNQTENKIHHSPQTSCYNTGYSRERCDSLPSRNRTSSDCTNINMTPTSVMSVRNYTLSSLRPHSHQRHSNSPPMNSTICSESEESSVSIDEIDDNGSFISYRFNSRSSEGVIPEENTDELVGSEKCNSSTEGIDDNEGASSKRNSLKLAENSEESYLSMAPVKLSKEINIFNLKNSKPTDDTKYASALSNFNRSSPRTNAEFMEYVADKMSRNYINEAELMSERPARSYSIGSKIEHIKMNKRINTGFGGNLQETVDPANATRVRAFSVGSRAKIPRCDLQRGALNPKLLMEHNCNNNSSNNNICTLHDNLSTSNTKATFFVNASHDKKSTSAPLLIHKSQNSVDSMGDLMEIDFSKSPTFNHGAPNRFHSSSKISQMSRSVPTTTAGTAQHFDAKKNSEAKETSFTANKESERTLQNFLGSLTHWSPAGNSSSMTTTTTQPTTATVTTTDNGYLEMKPVGDLFNKALSMKPKNANNSNVSITVPSAAVTASPFLSPSMKVDSKEYFLTNMPKINNFLNQMAPNSTIGMNLPQVISRNSVDLENCSHSASMPTVRKAAAPSTFISNRNNKAESASNTSHLSKSPGNVHFVKNNNKTQNSIFDKKFVASNQQQQRQDAAIVDNTAGHLFKKYEELTLNDSNKVNAMSMLNNLSNNKDDYINISQGNTESVLAKNNSLNNSKKNKPHIEMIHSNSDEEMPRIKSLSGRKSFPENKDTGYEILQMKSDSSLQTNKAAVIRTTGMIRKDKRQQQHPLAQLSTRSANMSSSSSPSPSPSPSASATVTDYACTSSSTSCLNFLPNTASNNNSTLNGLIKSDTPAAIQQGNATTTLSTNIVNANPNANVSINANTSQSPSSVNNKLNNTHAQFTKSSPLDVTSRPPSVSSEHELYYASLDLPQPSSTEITVGVRNTKPDAINVNDSSSPSLCNFSSNSYAKIDFDISDSSSSSSKNLNN